MATPFTWTLEREEELARLWREGVGAGAIAALLGFTRNAVLGKVHRLRRRPGGVLRFEARATTPPKRKPKRVKRSVPVPKVKPKVTHVAVAKPKPAPKPPLHLPKQPGPLTLLELSPTSCRFILGDVKGPLTLFCGRPKDAERGGSYCAEHRERCVSRPRAA